MVKRGEVWWYEPPYAKARPHLILTRDAVIPVLSDVLSVPATRTRRGIPTEIELSPDDGMPTDCVLTADNVTLIATSHLTTRITELTPERMSAVCEALKIATDC